MRFLALLVSPAESLFPFASRLSRLGPLEQGFCEGVIGQFRGSDVDIQNLKAAAPRIIASGAYTAAAAASPARGSSADTPMGTTGAESSVHVRSLDSPKESLDFAVTESLPSPTAAATSDADLLSPTPLRPPTRPPLGARATSSSSTTATLGVVSSLAGAPSSSRGHTVAGTMPSREPSPAVSDSDPFALDYEVDVDDDRRSSRSRPGSTATVARKSSVASTSAKALKAVNASEEALDFHPEALATPRPNIIDRPASPAHSLTESIDSYSESRGGSSAASHGGMDGRYDAEWDVFARYTRESVYHALAPQPQVASDATEPSPSTLRAIEPVVTPEDEPASLASRLRLRIQNTGRGRGNASASDCHPGTTMALPTLSPEPISSPTASDRSDHLQTPHQPSSSAFEGDVVENAGAEDPDEQEPPYDMSDSKRRWSYESSVNADAERSQVNLPDTPSHQRFAPPVSSPTPTWTPTLSPTMSSPRPNISNPPNPFGQAKPRGAFFPAPETDRPRSQSFSHFHFDRLEVPLPTESFVPEKLWLEDVSPPGRRNGSHTRQKSTASSLRSKMSRRGKTPEPQQQQPPDESPVPAERKPRRSLSIKSLRSKRETTPTTPTKLDVPPPMPKLTKQSSRVTPSESAVSSRDYFGTVSHDGTDFQVARAGETRHALPSDASHVEEDEWGFLGASPVPVVYRKHGRNVPKIEQAMLAIIAKRRTDGVAKKLGKMLAVDGAPPSIRFRVWCWLLGAPADRSAESQYHRLVDRYSAPKLEVFAIPPAFASHRAFQGDGVARLQEMIATLRYHKPKSYLGEGTCWLAMIVFMQAFDVSHAFALTDMVLDKFASQMSPDLIRTDAIVLESMVVEMDAKLALHLKACALNCGLTKNLSRPRTSADILSASSRRRSLPLLVHVAFCLEPTLPDRPRASVLDFCRRILLCSSRWSCHHFPAIQADTTTSRWPADRTVPDATDGGRARFSGQRSESMRGGSAFGR